uniref:Uncharacterized protein n=1 Tax=Cajanus cajan TaxID=3821 RepID=A0A151TPZ8_CAJCA|nr:hypothetical protein KK1_022696 [Cajanus cajan]
MCVDYTDLNKACPKDSNPLTSIDKLGAPYQRLMDKVFHQQIGRNMEVYVDDMVVKTESSKTQKEKLALALVTPARRLVVVKTNYLIKQILRKLELTGWMMAWLVELSEFDIKYESRGPLKAQCLADFVAELTLTSADQPQVWTLHVDGSSNSKGDGAGIILEGPNEVALEKALKFGFKVTNNQAEYEALLARLRLDHNLGARRVSCNSDSKLMISSFEEFTIHHVSREKNARADLLSKLASTKHPGQHQTIIQETLNSPSLDDKVVNTSDSEDQGWMTGIWNYLKEGILRKDKDEARMIRVRSAKFVIVGDELFKRGISTPLLKCLTEPQATYVIEGYPTLKSNCQAYVQKCKECQHFEDFLRELGVKHLPTSVEHPHTDGQAEAANKVILRELKKRLGCAKEQWETPYRLTYGADAMIPVEVGETSHRLRVFDGEQNAQEIAANLDLIDELRKEARIHEEACKLRASRSYNTRVRPRSFRVGDLVW